MLILGVSSSRWPAGGELFSKIWWDFTKEGEEEKETTDDTLKRCNLKNVEGGYEVTWPLNVFICFTRRQRANNINVHVRKRTSGLYHPGVDARECFPSLKASCCVRVARARRRAPGQQPWCGEIWLRASVWSWRNDDILGRAALRQLGSRSGAWDLCQWLTEAFGPIAVWVSDRTMTGVTR